MALVKEHSSVSFTYSLIWAPLQHSHFLLQRVFIHLRMCDRVVLGETGYVIPCNREGKFVSPFVEMWTDCVDHPHFLLSEQGLSRWLQKNSSVITYDLLDVYDIICISRDFVLRLPFFILSLICCVETFWGKNLWSVVCSPCQISVQDCETIETTLRHCVGLSPLLCLCKLEVQFNPHSRRADRRKSALLLISHRFQYCGASCWAVHKCGY